METRRFPPLPAASIMTYFAKEPSPLPQTWMRFRTPSAM